MNLTSIIFYSDNIYLKDLDVFPELLRPRRQHQHQRGAFFRQNHPVPRKPEVLYRTLLSLPRSQKLTPGEPAKVDSMKGPPTSTPPDTSPSAPRKLSRTLSTTSTSTSMLRDPGSAGGLAFDPTHNYLSTTNYIPIAFYIHANTNKSLDVHIETDNC